MSAQGGAAGGGRTGLTHPSPPSVETVAGRHPRIRPNGAEAGVVTFAALVFAWGAGRPSPWWDEAITKDVVSRPVADIISLADHVDLVHLAYYLLMHGLTGGDSGFLGLRMVSVVASALTAGVLVRIGRQLDHPGVGLCAGLLFAVAPLASRYAHEARSYALVTLLTTLATAVLLGCARRPWRRGGWVGYGLLIGAAGLLNLMSVLILLPHLVFVWVTADRPTLRRWATAAAGATLGLVPLAVGAAGQSDQLDWLPHPALSDLTHFLLAQYAVGLMTALLVALAVAGLRPKDSPQPGTHREALLLGVSWALLPPVTLWVVSQVHPLFDWRYVIFCLPGTALAIASLVTALRPIGAAVVVVSLAVGGLHMQDVYRRPAIGHAEDIRAAAQVVAGGARAGDGVLFLPANRRLVALAYPEQFAQVDDLALQVDPTSSATLFGVERGPVELSAQLHGRDRIWLVTGPARLGEEPTPTEVAKERMLTVGFRQVEATELTKFRVILYERVGGPLPSWGR